MSLSDLTWRRMSHTRWHWSAQDGRSYGFVQLVRNMSWTGGASFWEGWFRHRGIEYHVSRSRDAEEVKARVEQQARALAQLQRKGSRHA